MAKIVMFWDCTYCDNKGIPGYTRECEGCGHPRPRKVVFYHSDPPHVATATEAAKFGKPDPNWYCNYCDSGNLEEDDKCWKCGAPREADSEVQETRTYRQSEGLPHSSEEARKMAEHIPAEKHKKWEPKDDPYNPITLEKVSDTHRDSNLTLSVDKADKPLDLESFSETIKDTDPKKLAMLGGVVAGVIIVGLLIWAFFFRTHTEAVQVTDMNWQQTVHIEELQTFHEGGWSIPSGGRETKHYLKKSGDKKVHDGYHNESHPDTCYETVQEPDTCYRDNGDGSSDSYSCTKTTQKSYSCTKTEQVEDYHYEDINSTWYEYDIDRWTVIGDYLTNGKWTILFYSDVQPQGDKQRRIEIPGTYTVTFSSGNVKPFTMSYSLADYLSFSQGQEHTAVINTFGVVLSVK